jgi:hypothetical protein
LEIKSGSFCKRNFLAENVVPARIQPNALKKVGENIPEHLFNANISRLSCPYVE